MRWNEAMRNRFEKRCVERGYEEHKRTGDGKLREDEEVGRRERGPR